GTTRLKGSVGSAGDGAGWPAGAGSTARCAAISSASASHWACIMRGRRWMTTLRKLPTSSPKTAAQARVSPGVTQKCSATPLKPPPASRLDDLAELEDRQVHGDHQAADQRAQHHHDEGLHQRGQALDGVVHFALVDVRGLAEHGIE